MAIEAAESVRDLWAWVQIGLGITQAVATIAIAGLAVMIAYARKDIAKEQSEIARAQRELAAAKLRHDTFERRYAVFEATSDILSKHVRYCGVSPDEIRDYRHAIYGADFLFDPDMREFLVDIANKLGEYRYLSDLADSEDDNAATLDKARAVDEQISPLMLDTPSPLRERFKPFLLITPNA